MPHNTPEKRRAYINARAARLREENPEYVEAQLQKKRDKSKEYYEANKARIDAKHKEWYNEQGGKESSSKRKKELRAHSWKDYVEEQAEKRKSKNEYMKVWAQTDKGQRLRTARSIMRRCGLSIDDYDKQYDEQQGKCPICKINAPRYGKGRLVADHDHKSGQFRTLLCGTCNSGLGLFKEDIEIMKNAIKFIESLGGN